MKSFNYNNNDDSEVFIEDEIIVNGVSVNISACTLVGAGEGRLNEDTFALSLQENSLYMAVFDGATSLKQINGLKVTGAQFASHFLKDRFHKHLEDSVKYVMKNLNSALLEESLKLPGCTETDVHTLPSSTGVIAKIDFSKKLLEVANVMDSWAIAFLKNKQSILLTPDQNAKFDKPILALMQSVAKEKGITPREARNSDEVNQALIEMYPKRNNNPDGSGGGIINGDKHLEQYIETVSMKTDHISHILLGSDGLIPSGMSVENESDRVVMLEILTNSGLKGLIDLKHEKENSDPDFEKYIRYKMSDDATGIVVSIKN